MAVGNDDNAGAGSSQDITVARHARVIALDRARLFDIQRLAGRNVRRRVNQAHVANPRAPRQGVRDAGANRPGSDDGDR
jgi:hypothetical protein